MAVLHEDELDKPAAAQNASLALGTSELSTVATDFSDIVLGFATILPTVGCKVSLVACSHDN